MGSVWTGARPHIISTEDTVLELPIGFYNSSYVEVGSGSVRPQPLNQRLASVHPPLRPSSSQHPAAPGRSVYRRHHAQIVWKPTSSIRTCLHPVLANSRRLYSVCPPLFRLRSPAVCRNPSASHPRSDSAHRITSRSASSSAPPSPDSL
ncbi:hypothetical protein ACLOJK_006407 [Asimina triloba]